MLVPDSESLPKRSSSLEIGGDGVLTRLVGRGASGDRDSSDDGDGDGSRNASSRGEETGTLGDGRAAERNKGEGSRGARRWSDEGNTASRSSDAGRAAMRPVGVGCRAGRVAGVDDRDGNAGTVGCCSASAGSEGAPGCPASGISKVVSGCRATVDKVDVVRRDSGRVGAVDRRASAANIMPDLGTAGNAAMRASASAAERVGFEGPFVAKYSSRTRRTLSSSLSNEAPFDNNFFTRRNAVASAVRWCSALVPGLGTLGIAK